MAGVHNGPVPTRLTLLSALGSHSPGSKVRFLGWWAFLCLSKALLILAFHMVSMATWIGTPYLSGVLTIRASPSSWQLRKSSVTLHCLCHPRFLCISTISISVLFMCGFVKLIFLVLQIILQKKQRLLWNTTTHQEMRWKPKWMSSFSLLPWSQMRLILENGSMWWAISQVGKRRK